jgi:methyl-accepting chemotaxis protein
MSTIALTADERKKAFQPVYEKSDRIMSVVLIFYFVFGIGIAMFYGTWLIAISVGPLCLAAYFITKTMFPNHTVSQYVLSGIFAVFSAQFIYQMHGLFEMHFFFFVGSAFLITYRNWKLIIPLLIITVIHHSWFAWLQYSGHKEIFFTQLDYMDLQAFIFHVALAGVIMGICAYWAFDLGRTTITEAQKTLALEKQVANVKSNIAFAEAITTGNLENEQKVDENDELGKSLIKMRDSLRLSNAREEEEKFITVGITRVGDVIRKHSNDPAILADEFVKEVVKYTGLNQGALYVHEKENDNEFLRLTACYAYDRKKHNTKTIGIGEGLVGQCFLEKDAIYMTAVPRDYVKITSGLGEATPSCILLVPVKTSEDIVGVIELASFSPLKDHEKIFINRAAENIASAIVSSRTTHQIKLLLTDSQQRAEEMRAQEEEMRQNMEELQATQEEIVRKQAENEMRLRALNDSGVASIEFSLNGIIQTANEAFLNLMGYSLDEIQGKHHRMFVGAEQAASEAYRKFWEDLSQGIARPGKYERVTRSGDKIFIQGSYSIIHDHNGNPLKVLKLATDITEIIKQQEENNDRLTAINESGIAAIEFSLDGKIIKANQAFLNLMEYTHDQIEGKHHRIFVDNKHASSAEYKRFWEDLGRGISRPGQYERVTNSGKRVHIQGSYSILRDRKGQPARVLKLATDITRLIN